MTQQSHGMSNYESFLKETMTAEAIIDRPQNFGRLGFPNPITGAGFNPQKVIDSFGAALDEMRDTSDPQSDVEAGMTFFGQFIDHDITLDATSAIGSAIDPATIRNVRTPALELDSVYGAGPEASPFMYSKNHPGYLYYGRAGNAHDLPRNHEGTAVIGDHRNDENSLISQLHSAFIAFHNIALDHAHGDAAMVAHALEGVRSKITDDAMKPEEKPFEAARRIVRHHYQWLVLNDFLPAFVDPKVLKSVNEAFLGGEPPKLFQGAAALISVEFAVSAFRFGHATVQNKYRINDTVGEIGLFDPGFRGFKPRDEQFNIDFANVFDFTGSSGHQCARPISRKLAASIYDLPFVGEGISFDGAVIPLEMARKLPHRNVFRDRFALHVNSGQQMARLLKVKDLGAPKELTSRGISKTPLW
nr:peroxidase family protein [Rhizobiaceae bacterium]